MKLGRIYKLIILPFILIFAFIILGIIDIYNRIEYILWKLKKG